MIETLFLWFVPRDPDIIRWSKSKTLISFLLVIGLTCSLSIPISHAVASKFPVALLAAASIGLLLILKYTRSVYWVGNLTIGTLTILFAHTALSSGGMLSIDLAGMFLILILAFSVLDLKATLFWTAIIISINLYFYVLSKDPLFIGEFHQQHDSFPEEYFLKYNLVFLIVTVILLTLQKKLNIHLIKDLKRNKSKLDISIENLKMKSERLSIAKSELEQSISKLEQYNYAASHDLKQPIRTIISFTQLFEKRINKLGIHDESLNEYMYHIIEGTRNMNDRIEQLLSESTAPKIELRDVIDDYF